MAAGDMADHLPIPLEGYAPVWWIDRTPVLIPATVQPTAWQAWRWGETLAPLLGWAYDGTVIAVAKRLRRAEMTLPEGTVWAVDAASIPFLRVHVPQTHPPEAEEA
ncbi:protein of unknown function [Candidatus Hydrogenisulfobacillus filiaventi]|uniref:Uncharacterized protein n=1 Tax=Candidatus Hydrogenisulfobacillus filiaventi TaxID=2707344 RepID=A0A6F8ZER9_9FIRM|nr:hypothetical protein [Bacillota bacterium]CAB1128160.1 protein of unknown function [Candidatus Hydrogenisulfobacillus filiaventi]